MSSRILKSSYVVVEETKIPIQNAISLPAVAQANLNFPENEFDFAENPIFQYQDEITEQEGEIPAEQLAEKILERAREEAARIIKEANDDAELILNRMEAEAMGAIEELREQVREEAYNAGYEQGITETESIKEDARLVYANAVREKEETLASLESDVVDLITDILDKLLTDSINISPEVILYLVRKGFSESNLTGDVTIHVSDDDYETVLENKDLLAQYADAGSKIDILKDFSLKKSDCIIETPFGAIDCSLDQQYASLRKNLYFICESR